MGRNTDADKKPLLEDADQNIGNSSIVIPQNGNVGTVIPQTNPPRILDLRAGSAVGQTTSVVFTLSRILQGVENPYPGFPGPITGILEYGNGGRFTRVEFDLTVGPFVGRLDVAGAAVEPQDGVTTVTVPTGVLRAYARYDNLLLAPVLGTDPPQSLAQVQGVAPLGPGAPLLVTDPGPPPADVPVYPEPVLVKVMASYFNKPHAKTYKTIWCYCSNEVAAPTPVVVSSPTIIGGFQNYAFFSLPANTRRIKILRFPTSTELDVLLHNAIRPIDFVHISPNTAPEINVVGDECIVGLRSGQATVTMLAVSCEIGI